MFKLYTCVDMEETDRTVCYENIYIVLCCTALSETKISDRLRFMLKEVNTYRPLLIEVIKITENIAV